MLIQITAYVVLDRLVWSAASYDSEAETRWTMVARGNAPLAVGDPGDAHDVLADVARQVKEFETWRARSTSS